MKLRLFTGLAAALMLGGCATYDYVDHGGGYYVGSSPQYSGSVYGSYGYGYGAYDYGSSYYSYRYRPGWSFGVDYGYPYGWSSYPGGYYGGGYYVRPPYYPNRPVHPPRPGGHGPDPGGKPVHPPVAGPRPPRLDGAPWRNLEQVQRGRNPGSDARLRRATPYVQGNAGVPAGTPPRYPGTGNGVRPTPSATPPQAPQRTLSSGNSGPIRQYAPRPDRQYAPSPDRQYAPPRERTADGATRYRQATPQRELAPRGDGGQQRTRPAPQQRERPSRPAPTPSAAPARSETRSTLEP